MDPPRVEDGEAEIEAWRMNNAKALHAIHISCGEDTFSFIRGIDTAKAAWNILEEKLKPVGLPKTEDARAEHQSTMDGELQLKDLKPEPVVEGHRSYRFVSRAAGHGNNANSTTDDLNDSAYQKFFDCVKMAWPRYTSDALQILEKYPHPIRELRDPSSGLPALHFAASARNLVIVKELVRLMTEENFEEILDSRGRTALCCAFDSPGSDLVEIVKCMVEKNRKLLGIVDPCTNMIPLVQAFAMSSDAVTAYLYSITPHTKLSVLTRQLKLFLKVLYR